VTVVAVPVPGGVELRAVNDLEGTVDLHVAAHAVTTKGAMRALGTWDLSVPDDRAVPVATIGALAEDEILAFTWAGPEGPLGGDIFAPKPWKSYDLHPAALRHEAREIDGGWEITVQTEGLGLFVTIEADCPGRFSQNGFALFAGYPATVAFLPAEAGAKPVFTLRDLHAATVARAH
jgi:beta-mannosidase